MKFVATSFKKADLVEQAKQTALIANEYRANGYTVTVDAPGSLLGLDDLPITLDIVCQKEGESLIVDLIWADRAGGEAESLSRHTAIVAAIANRPEIDYEVRFFDRSVQNDKLCRKVVKLRDAAEGAERETYQKVLNIMEELGI